MFAGHKTKQAAKAYDDALNHWAEQGAWYKELIQTAQTFKGVNYPELVLGPGEAVFYKVTGAALIEDRRGAGHYEGRSSGISVPIGSIGGHSMRYRVGASHGHYVQGTLTPAAVDIGTVYITNKRVIFQGRKQTRECAFAKLIGFQHDAAAGRTTFSVSNRQKPTTVHYGPQLSGAFQFRLDLALAHYRGSVSELLQQLTREANALLAARPLPPSGH
jgi:hypothetical protein